MPVCAHCACDIDGHGEFHGYHADGDRQWSDDNRAWCNFFHRGIVLPREMPSAMALRLVGYVPAAMEEAISA